MKARVLVGISFRIMINGHENSEEKIKTKS